MMRILYIGIAGFLGTLTRYTLSGFVYRCLGSRIPFGTLVVNIIGSFLIGFLMEMGLRSAIISDELRTAMVIGFIGALTTFSTFTYETFRLLEDGNLLIAFVNIISNLLLCLIVLWLGVVSARIL